MARNTSFGFTALPQKRVGSRIVAGGLSEGSATMAVPTQPDKLMLAGDWHGNLAWAFKAINYAKSQGADTILHVGDFGWWRNDDPRTHTFLREVQKELSDLGLILYWVDGNHEDHFFLGQYNKPGQEPWCVDAYDRIVHLPRGYRWDWWGDTWMSLGGAYSIDRSFGVKGRDWWPGETLSQAQLEYAMRPGKVDIVVAHDAPMNVDIPGIVPGKDVWLRIGGKPCKVPYVHLDLAEMHRRFVQDVCDAVQPVEFHHGHYHKAYTGLARLKGGGYMTVRGLDKDETTMAANTRFITGGLDDDD